MYHIIKEQFPPFCTCKERFMSDHQIFPNLVNMTNDTEDEKSNNALEDDTGFEMGKDDRDWGKKNK